MYAGRLPTERVMVCSDGVWSVNEHCTVSTCGMTRKYSGPYMHSGRNIDGNYEIPDTPPRSCLSLKFLLLLTVMTLTMGRFSWAARIINSKASNEVYGHSHPFSLLNSFIPNLEL